jgi:hypothetical protein
MASFIFVSRNNVVGHKRNRGKWYSDTMAAHVPLAEKRHQESFGFSSSLALFNPSFMKGNQLTRRVVS